MRPDPIHREPVHRDPVRRDPAWPGLAWRAALPVAALLSLAAGGPAALSGGLALGGLVVALERLVHLRGLGLLDAVLSGVGGLVVAVVLTGMLMGSTGIRLDPTSWVVALAALGLAGLGVAAVLPRRTPPASTAPPAPPAPDAPGGAASGAGSRTARRTALGLAPWVVLAGVVVAVAVQMSDASRVESEAAPVALSLGETSGNEVEVVVSSSGATGPLEIQTSLGGNETSYPLVEVPADGDPVTTTVSLPRSGRFVITLTNPGQTEPLRTLVLDR